MRPLGCHLREEGRHGVGSEGGKVPIYHQGFIKQRYRDTRQSVLKTRFAGPIDDHLLPAADEEYILGSDRCMSKAMCRSSLVQDERLR